MTKKEKLIDKKVKLLDKLDTILRAIIAEEAKNGSFGSLTELQKNNELFFQAIYSDKDYQEYL